MRFCDDDVANMAKRRFVTIDAKDDDMDEARKLGTGFIYKTNKVIACVHNREVDAVYYINGRPGKILYVDKKTDLMALEIQTARHKPLEFFTDSTDRDPIFFYGNLGFRERMHFSNGWITKCTKRVITTNAIFFGGGCSGALVWHADRKMPIGVVFEGIKTDVLEIARVIPAQKVVEFLSNFEKYSLRCASIHSNLKLPFSA
jgi:hypothetical protein